MRRWTDVENSLKSMGYQGDKLKSVLTLLHRLEDDYLFNIEPAGPFRKTIQVNDSQNRQRGYINSSVRPHGVLGYRFDETWGEKHGNNACPKRLGINELIRDFCRRYKCMEDDVYIHRRNSTSYNSQRTFLIIRVPSVALRVLLQDTNQAQADLTRVLPDGEPTDDGNEYASSRGAGFGTPAENKRVEQAAIAAVRKHYENKGWSVESVESDGCGFDLKCRRNTSIKHVEVKGVRGDEQSFIITKREVEQAEENRKFVLFVVTSALSNSPKLNRYSGKEFLAKFKLTPVQYAVRRRGDVQ